MKIDNSDYSVIFEHGKVKKISPKLQDDAELREYIYNTRFIVSDGKKYDLEDRESVLSIEIPDYLPVTASLESPTEYLEYILQRKASAISKENRKQAIILLSKSNQLMLYSTYKHDRETYYRIVNWLEQDLDFDLAERWKHWIEEHVQSLEEEAYERFQRTLETCQELGTDLVEIPWCGGMSAVVAKYQGRVYSISGTDKRFPPLPNFIMQQGFVEPPFYGSIDPYFEFNGTIYYKGKNVDAKRISWRKFKDDRSPEEIEAYQKRRKTQFEKEQSKRNLYAFNRLRAKFPELTPKSLSTIYRWRDSPKPQYREKYDAIMRAVQEIGFEFPAKTLNRLPEFEDPEPGYNGGKTSFLDKISKRAIALFK